MTNPFFELWLTLIHLLFGLFLFCFFYTVDFYQAKRKLFQLIIQVITTIFVGFLYLLLIDRYIHKFYLYFLLFIIVGYLLGKAFLESDMKRGLVLSQYLLYKIQKFLSKVFHLLFYMPVIRTLLQSIKKRWRKKKDRKLKRKCHQLAEKIIQSLKEENTAPIT